MTLTLHPAAQNEPGGVDGKLSLDRRRNLCFALLYSAAVMLPGGCNARMAPPAGMPDGVRYISRVEWGARAPVLPMRSHVPVRMTIHHTGVAQNTGRAVEAKLRGLQAFSQRDDSLASGRRKPAWADVPYHYYVAVDGSVAEGREWRYVGDSNTPYDPTGHLLIVVEGNFENDTLSSAQRKTLNVLIPAQARRFGIPPASLAAHRDYAQTSCPGRSLYAELPRLRSLIPTVANMERKRMVIHAAGTFEVKLKAQAADDYADAASLGRMSIDKQFRGDLEGVSKGQMLTAMTAIEGSAGYVAIERVTGTLHGRTGSFVLQHNGTMTRNAPQLVITVVPDSGTGELTGLAGTMTIDIANGKHSYGFDYLLAGGVKQP